MMKTLAIGVVLAAMTLTSCASIDRAVRDDFKAGDIGNKPDNGGTVDYGPPTPIDKIGVDERRLTPQITRALELDDVATVIAVDVLGNVTAFVVEGEGVERPLVYPQQTKQVGRVYTASVITFEGSRCIDYIDTLGYARRICVP